MSWLFSRALVEAFSAASCLDGEPSAPLNVMPTPHKFWRNDKTMEPCDLSQFGLTCAVLTADHGEDLLMSFRAGFPARTSAALGGGQGLDGERSGLWREMVRIVRDVEPEWVYVENSPMLVARGLGVVLADLAALGFDAEWDVFSAADLGADHLRERIWIAAHTNKVLVAPRARLEQQPRQPANAAWGYANLPGDRRGRWVEMARKFRGMDDGLAYAVDRTAAIGNGQVPRVAAAAFAALAQQFN